MLRFRPALTACGWLLLAALSSTSASAVTLSAAVRSPATSDPSSVESVGGIDDIAELNPNLAPVEVGVGFTSVTSVFVDARNGILKGYAGFDRQTASDDPTAAPFSYVMGTLGAAGYLIGSGSAPVSVTIALTFDGSFAATAGSPSLNFLGTLLGGSTSGPTYTSQISFYDDGEGVMVEELAQQTITAGNITTDSPYAGATPTVFSATRELLAGEVRITFDALPGELISFGASLYGIAVAEFDEDSGAYLPSSGAVDFLHTGTLSIYVPQGYGFESDAALLQNVVQQVPEPATWLSMLVGLGLLGFTARRGALSRS